MKYLSAEVPEALAAAGVSNPAQLERVVEAHLGVLLASDPNISFADRPLPSPGTSALATAKPVEDSPLADAASADSRTRSAANPDRVGTPAPRA